MALWNHNGEKWHKVPHLYRKNLGSDVYLCCPGPSLRLVRNEDLHVSGALVAGITTCYPHIRPDVWMGLDHFECYDRKMWSEPFIKICRGGYQKEVFSNGQLIKDMFGVYYADIKKFDDKNIIFDLKEDIYFYWNYNTLAFALHVLLWMGAKNIYFVGADLGGDTTRDYYDDRVLSDEARTCNRRLYGQQVEHIKSLHPEALKRGINFYSCTDGSKLNGFLEYIPLEQALKATVKRADVPEGEMMDVRDVFKMMKEKDIFNKALVENSHNLSWKDEVYLTNGIMVVCNNECEWMLEWWWENYRKHNHFPVMFMDIGMSPEKRLWAEKRGFVFTLKSTLNGWFNKPLCMIQTIFEKTLYMDLDCEVRKPLDSLFELSRGDINVTLDRFTPFCKNVKDKAPVGSGVVCYKHKSEVVSAWAFKTLTEGIHYRGDQEILNLLRDDSRINILPGVYHRLRLEGDTDPRAYIFHHTGKAGKEIIKNKMKEHKSGE